MRSTEPKLLRHFPWATLGRRETPVDFFRKIDERKGFVPLLEYKPSLSVILPVDRPINSRHFSECLESLLLQAYPNWEALVIGPELNDWIYKSVEALKDSRIRILKTGYRSRASMSNEALGIVSGDWIGLLDSEDILSPATFYEILSSLQKQLCSRIFYTNEVLIDQASKKLSLFFSKPEYSYFNLIHFNMIGSFWMVKTALLRDLGGFNPEAGIHFEHEFFLRAAKTQATFELLPQFLLYRRKKSFDPSDNFDGLKAVVGRHLADVRIRANVMVTQGRGRKFLKVLPEITTPTAHLISVIIPFRDRSEYTIRAVECLLKQVGTVPVEILLVNNQSMFSELNRVKEVVAQYPNVRVVNYERPFNYAHIHNSVIRQYCLGDLILCMNNDVFFSGEKALDLMAAWAVQDWVGTLGILLRFKGGGIQHAGFRCVYGGRQRLARLTHVQEEGGFPYENKEVFGNTFAAAMFKKTTFEAIGGLREFDIPNGSGDVAFNFECLRRGLKNIYLGHIEAVHLESASRGVHYEYWETTAIERGYPDILQRMLRFDLGYDRVPGAEISFKSFLRHDVGFMVFEKAKWLMPFKPLVRWLLNSLSRA